MCKKRHISKSKKISPKSNARGKNFTQNLNTILQHVS